jgi:hypothetical protein
MSSVGGSPPPLLGRGGKVEIDPPQSCCALWVTLPAPLIAMAGGRVEGHELHARCDAMQRLGRRNQVFGVETRSWSLGKKVPGYL